jgi:hypothetical protein
MGMKRDVLVLTLSESHSATHNQQNTDFGRAQARSKLEDMGQNPDE